MEEYHEVLGICISKKDAVLFATSCLERTLPIFKEQYPNNNCLQAAVDITRNFACGKSSKKELDVIWEKVWNASWNKKYSSIWDSAQDRALHAALDAILLTATNVARAITLLIPEQNQYNAWNAVINAANAATHAITWNKLIQINFQMIMEAAQNEERAWQLTHLKKMISNP